MGGCGEFETFDASQGLQLTGWHPVVRFRASGEGRGGVGVGGTEAGGGRLGSEAVPKLGAWPLLTRGETGTSGISGSGDVNSSFTFSFWASAPSSVLITVTDERGRTRPKPVLWSGRVFILVTNI